MMTEETWKDYKKQKHFRPSPLKGIRVLEVCTLFMGPLGPGMLGQLGAEVIKCEIPPLGDTVRHLGPRRWKGQSPGLLNVNPNKLWLGLDLHKQEGQEIFRELAAKADIIEENLRPEVMAEWNVGYRQICEVNPSIIYIAKNGFGQWGEYAQENRPSNDGASQAFSGYASLSSFPGKPPLKSRLFVCDDYGALMGEVAVLAALHHRKKTGKGQYIELSQTENIMRTMSWVWPYQQITGKTAMPTGNRDVSICPADTFLCSDGAFVAVAAPAPAEFKGLCAAMGQPNLADDPKFKDHLIRLKEENAIQILKIIADWVRTKTCREIEALAEKHGFAAARVVNNKEIVENEHFRARGIMEEMDDPVTGKFIDHGFPVMMSRTPPKRKWSARPVGFDNEYIMKGILGKTAAEIKQMYDCGALGKWTDKAEGARPPADWDGKAGLIMSR